MYIEWYYYQVQASNLVQRSLHLFQNRSLIQFSGDEQPLNLMQYAHSQQMEKLCWCSQNQCNKRTKSCPGTLHVQSNRTITLASEGVNKSLSSIQGSLTHLPAAVWKFRAA